jgi:serine/threonine protein kinase
MGIIASDTILNERYRIVRSLAPDRHGRTYLATDGTRFNAECAIEELTPVGVNPETLDRAKDSILSVAALLYQLQHPQLPRFWATFEDQNRLFLVRDYVRGRTYGELLDERRSVNSQFSEAEVWKFLTQILPVIGYIHSKGFIHQDICPDNIILRDDPNLDLLPVPIDFGMVKEASHRFGATSQELSPVGQPGYIAPEKFDRGRSYPSSDLYSLAVTSLVLLTGKEATALFDRGNLNWDWRKWIAVSDNFVGILSRMLAHNPDDRYQSATEVLHDLHASALPASTPSNNAPGTSQIPTININSNSYTAPVAKNRVYSAITNFKVKSIWENPAIFIPLGLLVSLTAGFGAWFGMSQILQQRKTATSAPTAPIVAASPTTTNDSSPAPTTDFQNPTVPTTESSVTTTGDTIQPIAGTILNRDGLVDSGSTVKYRIQGTAGQTLDISTGSTQVLMSILDISGTPVDSKAERVASWRGELPTTGEYFVELKPIQGLDGKSFPFKIAVSQSATVASPPATETNIPGMPTTGIPNGTGVNTGIVPSGTPGNIPPMTGGTTVPATDNPTIPVVPISVPSEQPRVAPIPKTGTTSETPRRRRIVRRAEPNLDRNEETPRRRRRIVRQSETTNSNSNTESEAPRRRRRRIVKQQAPETPTNIDNGTTKRDRTQKLPEYKTPIAVPKPKTGGNNAPATNDSGGDEDNGLDTEQ